MQSKALLIAVAAFAVTATGVHAFGDTLLTKAGLNQEQITAVHEARELKKAGDFVAARDLLADAGITEDEIRAIHKQARFAQPEPIGANIVGAANFNTIHTCLQYMHELFALPESHAVLFVFKLRPFSCIGQGAAYFCYSSALIILPDNNERKFFRILTADIALIESC